MAALNRKSWHLIVWIIGLMLGTATAKAADTRPDQLELDVKAAFLPRFAAYVSWPPQVFEYPGDPIQLCVIGRDPFGSRLDDAATRQRIGSRQNVVRRFESAAEALHCHVAFVGGSTKQSIKAVLKALSEYPILTVTDDRFGPDRGIVHFTVKEGRVRFHINNLGAGDNELTISARLLSIALSVNMKARA